MSEPGTTPADARRAIIDAVNEAAYACLPLPPSVFNAWRASLDTVAAEAIDDLCACGHARWLHAAQCRYSYANGSRCDCAGFRVVAAAPEPPQPCEMCADTGVAARELQPAGPDSRPLRGCPACGVGAALGESPTQPEAPEGDYAWAVGWDQGTTALRDHLIAPENRAALVAWLVDAGIIEQVGWREPTGTFWPLAVRPAADPSEPVWVVAAAPEPPLGACLCRFSTWAGQQAHEINSLCPRHGGAGAARVPTPADHEEPRS